MADVDLDQLSFVTDSDDLEPDQPGAGRTVDKLLTKGGRWLERGLAKIPGIRHLDASAAAELHGKSRPIDYDSISFITDSDAATASSHVGHGLTVERFLSKAGPHVELWLSRIGERSRFNPASSLHHILASHMPPEQNFCMYCGSDSLEFPELSSLEDVFERWLLSPRLDVTFFRKRYISRLLLDRKFVATCQQLVNALRANNIPSRLIAIHCIAVLVNYDPALRVLFTSLNAQDALYELVASIGLPSRQRETLLLPARRALVSMVESYSLGAMKDLDMLRYRHEQYNETFSDEVIIRLDALTPTVRLFMVKLKEGLRDAVYQIVVLQYLASWFASDDSPRRSWTISCDLALAANVLDWECILQVWCLAATSDDPIIKSIAVSCLKRLYRNYFWYGFRSRDDQFPHHFWDVLMPPLFRFRAKMPTRYAEIPKHLLHIIVRQWEMFGFPEPTPVFLVFLEGGLHIINDCYKGDPLDLLLRRIRDPTFPYLDMFKRACTMGPGHYIRRILAPSTLDGIVQALVKSPHDDAAFANFKLAMNQTKCGGYYILKALQRLTFPMHCQRSTLASWLETVTCTLYSLETSPSCLGIAIRLPRSTENTLPQVFNTHSENVECEEPMVHLMACTYGCPVVWTPPARLSVCGPPLYIEDGDCQGTSRFYIGCIRELTLSDKDNGRLVLLNDTFQPVDADRTSSHEDTTYGLHVLAMQPASLSPFWVNGNDRTLWNVFDPQGKRSWVPTVCYTCNTKRAP